MPSSSPHSAPRWLRVLLAPFGAGMGRWALWLAYAALVVLIGTGESIRWVEYRDTLVSTAVLRGVHAMAGFTLAAALLLRFGTLVLGLAERLLRYRRLAPPGGRWLTPVHLLDAAWWVVLGLLVLSGLERYGQLLHGVSLLPGLDPAAWWALHPALVPYLYAILLLNALVRGRMAAKRALVYLHTP